MKLKLLLFLLSLFFILLFLLLVITEYFLLLFVLILLELYLYKKLLKSLCFDPFDLSFTLFLGLLLSKSFTVVKFMLFKYLLKS